MWRHWVWLSYTGSKKNEIYVLKLCEHKRHNNQINISAVGFVNCCFTYVNFVAICSCVVWNINQYCMWCFVQFLLWCTNLCCKWSLVYMNVKMESVYCSIRWESVVWMFDCKWLTKKLKITIFLNDWTMLLIAHSHVFFTSLNYTWSWKPGNGSVFGMWIDWQPGKDTQACMINFIWGWG